jgi:predicted ABC-type ATPase
MPNVVVIAGPNGAGKSTVAPVLLKETLGMSELINADLIAKGLSYFHPENVAIQSGRIMLNRIRYLSAKKADFAFETTLAARTFAVWIERLKKEGYQFHLVFLWLRQLEIALGRVEIRVKTGGHHVDDETVTRRYSAGIKNFFNLYEPLADSWLFYDNSFAKAPKLIALKNKDRNLVIKNVKLWTHLLEEYQNE